MTTVFLRTLVVYGILIGALRLMGKRQLGELEVSELVTALLISEIAALPIETPDLPILYALVPIITLLFIEIASSALLLRIPFLRKLFSSKPCILIRYGIPDRKALRQVRISLDELLSALRQKDVFDLREVAYAILEQNGQISVLKCASAQPPSAKSLGISVTEPGIAHTLVADGKTVTADIGEFEKPIKRALKHEKCRIKDIFLMTVNDHGNLFLLKKKDCHLKKKEGSH